MANKINDFHDDLHYSIMEEGRRRTEAEIYGKPYTPKSVEEILQDVVNRHTSDEDTQGRKNTPKWDL